MVALPETWDLQADLVAVGSSGGGLVGAIVGHDLGLRTVVLEKADSIGGGTALSGGALWVPCNHHMLEAGQSDSREEALSYIRGISLGRHDEDKTAAFLDSGPQMVRYLEEHTPLRLVTMPDRPDYHVDLPGGKPGGRLLVPDVLGQAKLLGELEKTKPILSKVRRSPTGYLLGRVSLGLPAHMFAGGRALIGALVAGCHDRGIQILTNVRARRLLTQDGRVIGLHAQYEGRDFFVKASKGVLLATGGYEWNQEMHKRFMPGPPAHAFTPPSNEGDGHIMGMELGAAIANMDTSIWVPVIHIPGEQFEGRPLYHPIANAIGQASDIVVNRHGKRCCNESFYPDIGHAFCAYDPIKSEYSHIPTFWICDQALRDKYPVGTLPVGTKMADWLHRASTVRELAERLGLNPDTLEETVKRFNGFAREGLDPDFHRGESLFDRWYSTSGRKPNPCLAPLEKPPFYGIQLLPGTVGHRGGLVANPHAQVLNVRGEVIPGLYGTSNTAAQTVVGYGYTSGLATAHSMVFGYVAARHLAQSRG